VSRLVEVQPGRYRDSVALMQVSRAVGAREGVRAALVAMATELNLELLAGMGFAPPAGAGPNDMVVAIEADDEQALAAAKDGLEAALAEPAARAESGFGAAPPPRTVGTAARLVDATLALVSTPGPVAFLDAMDALQSGLSVLLFSDNVPVRQEVRLKDEAARRGLLVMGPDCGTAVVGGVGLGFANVVRPGPVGLVAASGTGAQQLLCLLDGAGVGVSHCLGVGGRDLSAAVGGRSTLAALDLLADDPATELVVLVSKPPAPEVAEAVRRRAGSLGKPVEFALLGRGAPGLTAAAERAVRAAGGTWAPPRSWPAPATAGAPRRRGGALRGLFAGGTLCDEAMVIASERLGPIRSNIPLEPGWALPADAVMSLGAEGHTMIDYGDDRLTAGRPHPMIDSSLRAERLLAEAADQACGVLLLDVVLGHGAAPDPAAELAPAISAAHEVAGADGRALAVVVSLIGSAGDPQDTGRQALILRGAGASVYLSNAEAARAAVSLAHDASGADR
jgi:FdrA protein